VPAIGGGPSGRPWRRARARVLAASDVCYLCAHPGAGAVDYVISRKLRPDLALDPANLRPVHGSLSRCPVCRRACNESAAIGVAGLRADGLEHAVVVDDTGPAGSLIAPLEAPASRSSSRPPRPGPPPRAASPTP
jgi:hypothetical protein